MKNAGWLFYRNYYAPLLTTESDRLVSFVEEGHLRLEGEKKDKVFFTRESEALTDFVWDNTLNHCFHIGNEQFELETTYPGLVIGSGYSHQTGALGEFKLGFFFDYATGLPLLPGSSVKGLIRSAFPGREQRPKVKEMKTSFIQGLLGGINESLKNIDVTALEQHIFEGKNSAGDGLSAYQHDIFLDAFITKTTDTRGNIAIKGAILAEDYITPHSDALKNPIPVRFMKIRPGVTFKFCFDLKDSQVNNIEITAEDKRKLFETIICHLGIGAKTNVGYGQFK